MGKKIIYTLKELPVPSPAQSLVKRNYLKHNILNLMRFKQRPRVFHPCINQFQAELYIIVLYSLKQKTNFF